VDTEQEWSGIIWTKQEMEWGLSTASLPNILSQNKMHPFTMYIEAFGIQRRIKAREISD